MKLAGVAIAVVLVITCGMAQADKIALKPAEVEIECDGDAVQVEAHYKGQATCALDLIVDWGDVYLDDVEASDFKLGAAWQDTAEMYWNAWDCDGCLQASGRHIHVNIIDGSDEGVTLGCIFAFDVHDESYCDTGETVIEVIGVAYDCDDPPDYIEPLLFPQDCTVTITNE